MISNESIIEKIRLSRINRGFSQENMADMLNISTTAYGDIERGKTELTIPRLLKIGQILSIELADLLNIESKNDTLIQLENEKNKIEIEKLRLEVNYWKDKFERAILIESFRLIKQQQEQIERPRIGFQIN
jgi:XRE family transcriptional regulator, regulator of sulfur utilization